MYCLLIPLFKRLSIHAFLKNTHALHKSGWRNSDVFSSTLTQYQVCDMSCVQSVVQCNVSTDGGSLLKVYISLTAYRGCCLACTLLNCILRISSYRLDRFLSTGESHTAVGLQRHCEGHHGADWVKMHCAATEQKICSMNTYFPVLVWLLSGLLL